MMFADDIDLVRHARNEFSPLPMPLVDVGGYENATTLRANGGIAIMEQVRRPWAEFDPDYTILNEDYGDPQIELLPRDYKEKFGTVLCLGVLERVRNPIQALQALNEIAKPGALIIVSTVFCYPYHPSPQDYWRFTQDGLALLAEYAYLRVLESGRRVSFAAEGIRNHIVDVRSVHLIARK